MYWVPRGFWVAVAAGVMIASTARGEAPPGAIASGSADDSTKHESNAPAVPVERLLEELESPDFAVRQRAVATLKLRLSDPAEAIPAAKAARQALRDRPLSLEARLQIEAIVRQGPAVSIAPPQLAVADLERLVDEVDDDAYAMRCLAVTRLQAALGEPKLVCPLLTIIKRRLTDPALSLEGQRLLEPLYHEARARWITSDPADWQLPEVSDEQIARLLDLLCRPATGQTDVKAPQPAVRHEVVQRELVDLLVRDDTARRVQDQLLRRLGDPRLSPDAAARLRSVHEWTQPAMVAEYWSDRRHLGVQYLIIALPNFPPGAQRASLFDRCDDQSARCVSGNSLEPGEYPVGVAFPHPIQEGAIFHLVNLPTARRRLAYDYALELQGETDRLAAISRRTLEAILAARRSLSDAEVQMLAQLDPAAVSRFVGPYFRQIEDVPARHMAGPYVPGGRLSRHSAICLLLASRGTHEAIPGLVEALRAGRIEAPAPDMKYHLPWIAALAIAARDPWPGIDAWLHETAASTEPLMTAAPVIADVGATAAALLAQRNGGRLEEFGLERVEHPVMVQLGLQGYRFADSTGRNAVRQWWAQRQAPPPLSTP